MEAAKNLEVESLLSSLAQLESELKEKEKDVHTAAELGKKLLESNQELQNQLDENIKSYSERIESLEQEKFSLQQRLEAQKATADTMQQELEAASSQLEQSYSQKLKHSEENHSRKVHELSKVNSDLKAENEKLEVQLRTSLEKVRIQEETIEQLREDVTSKCNTSLLQTELKDLEQLYADEKSHGEELRLLVVESEGNVEMLSVELASLQEKVVSLEEECQDRSRMANEWYDALKESKDQNAELNCQLEALKTEVMGEGHGRSGNSLFGEVDDRRMQIERKMISLQVRYETLEKTHSTTQHQLRKMKADMSALLCQYGATSADAAHTQRLQRALAQCKSENQVLLAKLHRLEKQQAESASAQRQMKGVSAFVDFGDKTEYIQFLEQELEQVKGSHGAVIKELDMKRTQLLWESNKLSEAEAKIHRTEQEIARLKKEFTKARMKLQESTEKLAEAELQSKQLLADKAYLEEQLKTRGTKNRTRGKNQEKVDLDVTGRGNSLCKSNQSEEGGNKAADETVLEEGGEKLNNTKTVTTIVKREINILDDLEKEFNKQKHQQRKGAVDSWHPAPMKEVRGRVSESGSVDGRRSANSSGSRSEAENTPESSFLSTVNTSRSAQPTVPPKVIHVNNTDTVNECPQQ